VTGERWALGVDLGGTKVEVASVDETGHLLQRVRRPTEVNEGVETVVNDIADSVRELGRRSGSPPVGVGVGVAGQVEAESGLVRFAPNLEWHSVPLGSMLSRALDLPVAVTNDVRAATWGEWLHGAGQGCDDLVCLFVGTGIGGGVVSAGKMITGCANSAGELGHITIDLKGPPCHCPNHGCLEALAGGWAITLRAQRAVDRNPKAGATLLRFAQGDRDAITAETVAKAFRANDPLASDIIAAVGKALVAGCVSLINAFNPCRLILGGGVMEGMPELIERVSREVPGRALQAAAKSVEIRPAELHNDAGVIGAATLALRAAREGGKQN